MSFIKIGTLSSIISSDILCSFLSLLSFWDFHKNTLVHLVVPRILRFCLLFFNNFFFFLVFWRVDNFYCPIFKSTDSFFYLLDFYLDSFKWILHFSYCTFQFQNLLLISFNFLWLFHFVHFLYCLQHLKTLVLKSLSSRSTKSGLFQKVFSFDWDAFYCFMVCVMIFVCLFLLTSGYLNQIMW